MDVEVVFANVKTKLRAFVASGVKQNILGRDWILPLFLHKISLSDLQRICSEPNKQTLQVENTDQQLAKLVDEFSDVFQPNENKCSKTTAHLYLKEGATPVFKKARPVPLALRDKVKDELDRLKRNGILEEIDHSEWAAPCVIVRKPNGAIRICADFSTGLNQALKVQQFPLPTQDDLLTKIGSGQKFTTLDLSDAYLSIPMDTESKKLLVINTIFGLMRYNRLCFGVAPATAIFQKKMHSMLSGLDGVAFLLDDVIITGKNDTEHLNTLKEVLKRIEDNGFCLNRAKCHFMKEKVNYLGLCISKDGISTNQDKIKPIVDMHEPQNIKQLESFIGMANFYSKFIPNFSEICAPLNKLRQKSVQWTWTKQCSQSINRIKDALVSTPILVPFNGELPIVVVADASSVGIGCAIFHRYPNGEEKPIAYASKTLNKAEQNYSQIEREALALIYAIKKFRIYLWGTHFLIQTDHRPLLSIFGSSKGVPVTTSCRIQRWALFLTNFRFDIEYVSTKLFGKVDCLSRLPFEEDVEFDQADESYSTVVGLIFSGNIDCLPVTAKEISEETSNDVTLNRVKEFVLSGWPNKTNNLELKPYESRKNEISIHEGCLMWGVRAIVPEKFKQKLLMNLHDTHLGMVKMKALARDRFWWPSMDNDIENVARTCALCNLYAAREPQRKFLSNWPRCTDPWTRIHLDFAGPFLNSDFLLVVDAYSGWPEIIKLNSMTTSVTIKQIKLLICRYGIPKTIVTDNGPCFTSVEFAQFCKAFGIDHVTTPPYHPCSNGQVEKYVGTMKQALRKLCQEQSPKGLEADLNNFLFKYRLTPHITSGMSPSELFLGRQLRCILDLVQPQKGSQIKTEEEENKEDKTKEKENKEGATTSLKNFKINEPVFWAETRNGNVVWKPGVILKKLGRNVWKVEGNNRRIFKKHADQLKHKNLLEDKDSS
ncbi:uncharacterized protein K02A2.6-like [Macrosteles quadrilineatus]|uniref:uncharacterized protein K02A2.6-like n=1 Tax=Macrosteles quadrilineatus TaxID=74068 RepID=UPI0023E133A2|nr:uncharacterized protein K02A2.6-like [Macrosteles quadrilineatus]